MHKTGIPILAFDISPYRSHVVLAGREILKTVRVEDARCVEDFNLRSRIIAYASTHNTSRDAVSAQHRDQLSAYDVKWSHGKFDSTIATAAANGRVVIYDLNSTSIEVARLHEHTRQVHKVAFNPHQGALLLSGSQDATIRMWDLRALGDERSVRTCGSINRFPGNSEGVRDIKWSPSDGVEFAVGTDNGTLQKWDFRKDNTPMLKLNAHEKTCHSIDWHPSGKFLASGGADKVVKVWNLKSSDRRMKPLMLLRTPQAVRSLKWRLGLTKIDSESKPSRDSSFLATAYDARDPRIHVWDLTRPHVPFQELDRYDTPATDILWHSEELLWSVGSTGAFTQTDMKFAARPYERHNTNVLRIAPNGTVFATFDKRPRRHVELGNSQDDSLDIPNSGQANDETFSSSQSANEGILEEPNILNSSLKKRRQKFANSQLTAGTAAESGDLTTDAAESSPVFLKTAYESQQSIFVGNILGVFDMDGFSYLARNYKLPTPDTIDQSDSTAHETIRSAFEVNAACAEYVGMYRLAQSWRIVGQAAYEELLRRARDSKQARNNRSSVSEYIAQSSQANHTKERSIAESSGTKPFDLPPHADSYSNVSTPLARPATEPPAPPTANEDSLAPIKDMQLLGPGWKMRTSSQKSGDTTTKLVQPEYHVLDLPRDAPTLQIPEQEAKLTGHDRTPSISFKGFGPDLEVDMQAKRTAIKDYRAKPRAVLDLDSPFQATRTLSVSPQLHRHDSEESFQMFSASADSDHPSITIPESFEEKPKYVLSGTPELASSSISQAGMKFSDSLERRTSQGQTLETSHATSQSENPLVLNPESTSVGGKNIQKLQPVARPIKPLLPRIHVKGVVIAERPTAKSSHLDFLPSDFTPPESIAQDFPPWNINCLVPPLLAFHLETLSDPHMPSVLALHLFPFFPSLFPELQTRTYLSAYHNQLTSLQLHSCAAAFRKACETHFSDIADKVYGAGFADWSCRRCNKPVKGESSGFCRRCEQYWGECPICESSLAPRSDMSSKVKAPTGLPGKPSKAMLWSWCQGCGHGGHGPCLASWFADSDTCEGTCPVVGCGHDCTEGLQREATVARIEREKRRDKRSVARDEWAVGESRAVEQARGMVGSQAGPKRSGDGGGYRGLTGFETATAGTRNSRDAHARHLQTTAGPARGTATDGP